MALIIENIVPIDVSIDDLGIYLVPGQKYDLTQDQANAIAASNDLKEAIAGPGSPYGSPAGPRILVYDPLDDITPLSVSDALKAINAMNDAHFRIVGGRLNDIDDVTTGGSPMGNYRQLTYDKTTKMWYPAPSVPPPPEGDNAEYSIQLKWGEIPAVSGTATIPYDNTTPLITEGVEIWNQMMTIQDVNSTVRVTSNFTFSSSSSSTFLIIAVFRSNTCIGVGVNSTANKSEGFCLSLEIFDELFFGSPQPEIGSPPYTYRYSARVGKSGPGTWYVNAIDGGSYFNGLLARNSYTVEEIGLVE